ncbi:MAG: hypothetical protein H7Y06_06185 [Opitutaceae bacterium]|nr:hypothetical protein [Opitutaceae bacterium]
MQPPDSPVTATFPVTSEIPAAKPAQNWLQKLLAVPFFGGWAATIIGIIVPIILVICVPISWRADDASMIWVGALLTLWNRIVTRFFKVTITTPVIPIPLWIIGILLTGFGVYDTWFDGNPNG